MNKALGVACSFAGSWSNALIASANLPVDQAADRSCIVLANAAVCELAQIERMMDACFISLSI